MKKITKNTPIEELVNEYPKSVKYLMDNGIRCIVCGEPIWGTLAEACKEKNFKDNQIEQVVEDLNRIIK